MRKNICVKVAHHISGFWIPQIGKDKLRTGSIGAGFLISPYSITCYSSTRTPVINHYKKEPSVIRIIKKFFEKQPSTHTREPLPLGRGYASSASIAIGYALLSLMHNEKPYTLHTVGKIAHIAEIEAKTGLGDVSAIIQGSQLPIRKKPGAPGISIVDSIKVKEKINIITVVLGAQSTRELLKGKMSLYSKHGKKSYEKLIKNPTLETLVEVSREFSEKTGMLNNEIINRMHKIEKKTDIIGYFMKKRLLVIISRNDKETIEYLKKEFKNRKIRKHKLVDTGVIIK